MAPWAFSNGDPFAGWRTNGKSRRAGWYIKGRLVPEFAGTQGPFASRQMTALLRAVLAIDFCCLVDIVWVLGNCLERSMLKCRKVERSRGRRLVMCVDDTKADDLRLGTLE